MRTVLSRNPFRIPAFGSKWLYGCFGLLIVGQFLDGLTTRVGLDLGLAEVGTYAMPVLGTHGFWGLMVWKSSIMAAIGLMYFFVYYAAKRHSPAHLRLVTMILTFGCLIGFIVTIQVDVSNIIQIELALHNA